MRIHADNPFFSFMSKVGDCIYLNIIFIISCIPVITIGASITALFCAVRERMADRESYVRKDFVRYFKENFKNSTCMWIPFLIATIALYRFTLYVGVHLQEPVVIGGYLIFFLLYSFTIVYAFPLQATFINTPGQILINSLLTALRHLPYTLGLFFVTFAPMAFTLFMLDAMYFTIPYWLFIGFSLNACLSNLILKNVLKIYMPKSDTPQTGLE